MIVHEAENSMDQITGRNVEILPGTPHFSIELTQDQVLFVDEVNMRHGYRTDRPFYWSKHFRPTQPYQVRRLTHELMGILGVATKVTKSEREWYSGYYVDPLNEEALETANISGLILVEDWHRWSYGPFRKILEQGDLGILSAVWERDKELRRLHGPFWTPAFHATEVAKLAGVEPQVAREAIPRLVGLLARKSIFTRPTTRDHWFVPAARRRDVEGVLAHFPQDG